MADFTPTWTDWTDPGPFRFWAQKVLPLVYDDSLSYYEVLCKVVAYLNTTIQNVAALGGNVEGLRDAYEQLQQFVNDYFDNLDVQHEINTKLDEMAETGALTTLIEPFVNAQISNDVFRWLDLNIKPTTPAIDASLTVSGAGADAKVTGDKLRDLTTEITDIRYSDICKIDELNETGEVTVVPDFINNNVVTATGAVGAASTIRVTNKTLLYVPEGATYQTIVTSEIYNPRPWCFDENGTLLGVPENPNTMFDGTRYLRFMIARRDNGAITPEQAKTFFTFKLIKTTIKSLVDDLADDIPEIVRDEISSPGTNKFNPATITTGYISTNTGSININADYFTSDFIDVSSFTQGYAFTPAARKILFYDADKNPISASYHSDTTPAGVISLNSDYKYMRLSWYNTSTNVMVADASTLPAYEPYEDVAKDGVNFLNNQTKEKVQQMIGDGGKGAQIASFLNGKTVLVFGDSIMHGAGNNDTGIADLLAAKYGMIPADYSVSGATMGVRTDDPSYTVDELHHIAKQVRNAIAAGVTPDLIIFDGGTNDIGGEIPIGTMSEVYTQPSEENLFANGFETVAYLLMQNFVGVPIIYMRAHNMSSRSYQGQIDYGELGNSIAEKWGIRNVDMYKRMNTQLAEYRTAYLADYTHPNNAGYNKYYIPALEDFIFRELI